MYCQPKFFCDFNDVEFFFCFFRFLVPVKCAHRMPPIRCGRIVSVCWPMVSNVVYWRRTVWYRDRAFKCAKTTRSSLMWKIIWKVWRWPFTGTESIIVARSTMTVCHSLRNVQFSKETHSGMQHSLLLNNLILFLLI